MFFTDPGPDFSGSDPDFWPIWIRTQKKRLIRIRKKTGSEKKTRIRNTAPPRPLLLLLVFYYCSSSFTPTPATPPRPHPRRPPPCPPTPPFSEFAGFIFKNLPVIFTNI